MIGIGCFVGILLFILFEKWKIRKPKCLFCFSGWFCILLSAIYFFVMKLDFSLDVIFFPFVSWSISNVVYFFVKTLNS